MDTDDLQFPTQETSSTSPLRLEYDMKHKRREKAVMVNNNHFDYKKRTRKDNDKFWRGYSVFVYICQISRIRRQVMQWPNGCWNEETFQRM